MTSEIKHAGAAGRSWSPAGLNRAAAAEASAVSLLDTLSEVVFRTDADGRWTYLNRAWTTLTGFDVGPSLGARLLDYVHPEEVAHTATVFADLARGQAEQCLHETRCRTGNGGYRRVRIRAGVLRGAAGEVLGSTGTLVDVTGSRSALRIAGEQATLLESVTGGGDDLPTGVAVYGADLRLRRFSPAVARLVGLSPRAGDPLDLLAGRGRPAGWGARPLGGEWGLVRAALRSGRTQLGDLALDGVAGPVRSLRACVIPFREDGEELAAVVLSDITDLRAAEQRQSALARLGQRALAGPGLSTLITEAVEIVAATLEVAVCEVIRCDGDGGGGGDLASASAQAPTDALTDPPTPPAATSPVTATMPRDAGPIHLTGPLAVEARSLLRLALDVDEPVVVNDLDASPHLRGGWSDSGVARAALAARVGPAAAPFGVLAVASALPGRFTGDEARFVQAVGNILGAAIDRDRAERRTRQLYEDARRGREWLAASARVTVDALVAGESQPARMLLASTARGLTCAEVGAVALPDEAGNLVATEVDCAGHRHADSETLHSLALALEAAENRPEFLGGQPVHVDGLDDSDSWSGPIALVPPADSVPPDSPPDSPVDGLGQGFAARPAAAQPAAARSAVIPPIPPIPPQPRLREALVIPLTAAEGPIGALVLGNGPDGPPFAANDPALAGEFANDAAAAIQLAETYRERARLAVLADRERIARDLHDLVIQRLYAIGLHLRSLSRAVGDVTAARLNAAINGLDSSIDDIRSTIFRLQPTPAGA
ncbi:PAS domain S-box-containing protein [Frankia sp. EI5c]|uniref:PAS domain-containing protein n=1 Tax=Frankia sp. EI5c TaxID=683316 RepID=UPI0007C341C0|nr:PAS domain-containing protein [Frankia sp. EI5c]OAA29216.1 PAS domain S-box-containing protein [Frankia sp. EI5c]